MAIHLTALIDPGATVAAGVEIGPYCVVGPHVALAEGARLVAHVHVAGHTSIGSETSVFPFASLGTAPQSARYRGGPTRLVVGANCIIREGVTINTGTEDGGGITEIGDHCFLMAGSHVGHDCRVGSHVIFANNAVLGGHVSIGDGVFIGGNTAVHQFVRIGEGAMVAGVSGVRCDVIPFGFALGQVAELVGLNIVGLTRSGHSRRDMHVLRRAYRALFADEATLRRRIEQVARDYGGHLLVDKVIAFALGRAKRPLMTPARAESAAAGRATDDAA